MGSIGIFLIKTFFKQHLNNKSVSKKNLLSVFLKSNLFKILALNAIKPLVGSKVLIASC